MIGRALLLALLFSARANAAQDAVWSGEAEAAGVRASIRKAPLFSKQFLDGVRGGTSVPEVVRLTFDKPGWFLDHAVEAGSYALGFGAAGGDLLLTLSDARGAVLSSDSFWIEPPTETAPSVEVSTSDGAVLVTIACEGIKLTYRFVPAEALAAVAPGVETREGRVILVSDLGRPEVAAAIAKEADRAIDTHADLFRKPAPKGPFRIFLLGDEKTYQAADKLVTGGRFQRNGAVASPLTMQAYLWYVPRHDADAFRDAGATLKSRALVLHELGHLVAYASCPGARVWPYWLTEGLAEEGTHRALGASSEKDAADFHADLVGRWRCAEATGNLPPLEDLLTRYAGADLHGWYSSAYLFAKCLAAEGKTLPGLLALLEREHLRPRSILAAREALDARSGAIWRSIREETMRGPAPAVALFGHLDETKDGWRLATKADGQGRVVLSGLACRAEGAVEATFAWQPVGSRQADLYLAYAAGRESAQFLKVAVLPKRIVLFRFYDERWEEWGRRDFEEALAESDGKTRAWHSLKVELRSKERALSVAVDGARRAEFPLRSYVPTEGTWTGFGAYDSIVYFKDLRSR